MTAIAKPKYSIRIRDNISEAERLALAPAMIKSLSEFYNYSQADLVELVKATPPKGIVQENIWSPHRIKTIGDLEDEIYLEIAEMMVKIQKEIVRRFGLGEERATLKKALPDLKPKDMDMIDDIMAKYFPPESRIKGLAEKLAIKSTLIGMMRAQQISPTETKKLPKKISEAMRKYKLPETQARAIEFHKHHGASLIRGNHSKLKEGVRRVIVDGYRNNQSINKIRSRLFDEFGTYNRDWRRIAVTEISAGDSFGFLESIEEGSYVIGNSAADACDHCKELIHGKIYRKSSKEGDWDNTVWSGKSNVGRYFSQHTKNRKTGMWEKRQDEDTAKPTIPLHPYCRCNWTEFNPEDSYINKHGFVRMKVEDPDEWSNWKKSFDQQAA